MELTPSSVAMTCDRCVKLNRWLSRVRRALDTGPKSGRSARILRECEEDALCERWLAQFWTTSSTIHAFGSARRRSASYIMALSLS